MRVKSLGITPGSVNARPPGRANFANAPPPGTDKAGKCHAVARGEGGGGWVQLELTDALLPGKILLKSKFDIATHVETGFATHKHNYNKHQQWCIL